MKIIKTLKEIFNPNNGIIVLKNDSPELVRKKAKRYRETMDFDGKRWKKIMGIEL